MEKIDNIINYLYNKSLGDLLGPVTEIFNKYPSLQKVISKAEYSFLIVSMQSLIAIDSFFIKDLFSDDDAFDITVTQLNALYEAAGFAEDFTFEDFFNLYLDVVKDMVDSCKDSGDKSQDLFKMVGSYLQHLFGGADDIKKISENLNEYGSIDDLYADLCEFFAGHTTEIRRECENLLA